MSSLEPVGVWHVLLTTPLGDGHVISLAATGHMISHVVDHMTNPEGSPDHQCSM